MIQTINSLREMDNIIIPDIRDTCSLLASGINRDIDEDYKDIKSVSFNLVVRHKDKNTLIALILDNKYKLSKTILDTDEGREAVVIPLKTKPLTLDKYRSLEFERRYILIRKDLTKILFKLYWDNKVNEYLSRNYKYIKNLKDLFIRNTVSR